MASKISAEQYDVIIIGGGISGLYTAWRLANSTSLKILVLEATNRFGGKFMTVQMPGGFSADMGAMRYSPGCHPLMQKLIENFEVNTQMIDQVDGSNKKDKFKFYMRDERMSTLEEFRNVYPISDKDLPHFLAVNRVYFGDHPKDLDVERTEDGNFANSIFKPTGQMAKDMTVSQYLLQSNNAELFTLSMSFYPPNNWQVAVADGKLQLVTKHWNRVNMVDGGYETIINTITSALNLFDNVTTKRNNRVQTITETELGFSLTTVGIGVETAQYQCPKVIYACSKTGLSNIVLQGGHHRQEKITELTNNVSMLPAFKLYLTYNRAWWEDCAKYQGIVMTDLPIHSTIIFGDKAKSGSQATLLAAYSHRFIEIFQGLDLEIHERFVNTTGHISDEFAPSKLLVENVHNQLKKLMGCPDLTEEPVCAARHFWGTGDYGGMSYYPNLGVDSNQLHWDSLKPFDDADIFITGDTFTAWDRKGCYLGFAEGVLLTSERILVNHFGLKPLMEGLCLQNPWPTK